ncbi:hypothetical protein Dimus_037447 [Dionaea muscipula]
MMPDKVFCITYEMTLAIIIVKASIPSYDHEIQADCSCRTSFHVPKIDNLLSYPNCKSNHSKLSLSKYSPFLRDYGTYTNLVQSNVKISSEVANWQQRAFKLIEEKGC